MSDEHDVLDAQLRNVSVRETTPKTDGKPVEFADVCLIECDAHTHICRYCRKVLANGLYCSREHLTLAAEIHRQEIRAEEEEKDQRRKRFTPPPLQIPPYQIHRPYPAPYMPRCPRCGAPNYAGHRCPRSGPMGGDMR